MTAWRVGTRGSLLARTQAATLAQELERVSGRPIELVPITTTGDRSAEPLDKIGGTGVFVAAVREALHNGDVDLAVHSLKDLPTAPAQGLALTCIPRREDPRDAVCTRDDAKLADLPPGARVGTGAPRRVAQLRAAYPQLTCVPLRGNVDSRLGRVRSGELDAVVLAAAGLARLGRSDEIAEFLDPAVMLPAAGQGALAVETQADAPDELTQSLRTIDDPATRAAVTAERTVLATLEAGCTAPLGVLAELFEPGFWEPEISLQAVVVSPDGTESIRRFATGSAGAAAELGHDVATQLLAAGAGRLLGSARREP